MKEKSLATKEFTASWAEWRKDFPLEVLNGIADFYEEIEDLEGHRIISSADLEYVGTNLLGIPADALIGRLQARKSLPVGSVNVQKGEVELSSLQQLLTF